MDEFSDFQMAVGNKTSSTLGGRGKSIGKGGSGLWVLDHSPVHSIPNNNSIFQQKSGPPRICNMTHQSTVPSSVPPTTLFPLPVFAPTITTTSESNTHSHGSHSSEMSSVGSRLANYNLGIKASTGITGTSSLHNQSLMGEEDRYAALRSLVDTTPENSQKSSSHSDLNPGESGGWQHKQEASTRVTNTSNINPNDDFASDFGDFQSFKQVQSSGEHQNPSVFRRPSITCGIELEPVFTSQKHEEITKVQNGSSYELEFGDFVSVKPSFAPALISDTSASGNLKKTNRSVMAPSAQNQALEQFDFFCSNLPSHEITTAFATEDSLVTNGDLPSAHFSAKNSILDAEPFHRPSFIKTSLIGYDAGINDIDTSKCASLDESNSESLDCGFMGQKDLFNTFEKHKSFDISPETRSLASLDLGNYYSSSDYNDNGKPATDQFTPKPTDNALNNKSLMTMIPVTLPNMNYDREDSTVNLPENSYKMDKYQCFKEEIKSEKEHNSAEWTRCLEFCKGSISNAITIFNGASSSDVIREVVSDEIGLSYVKNMLELFLVCTRIHKSWARFGGSTRVGNLCRDLHTQWETLSSFFIGTSVMDLVTFVEDLKEDTLQEGHSRCGVCLIETDRDTNSDLIDYEGKLYHSTCANLWVNVVDTILPSLSSIPSSSVDKNNHSRLSGDQASPYI